MRSIIIIILTIIALDFVVMVRSVKLKQFLPDVELLQRIYKAMQQMSVSVADYLAQIKD